MKKLISLLIITTLTLTLLTSCGGKVKVDSDATVAISYDYEGTSISSTLTGNSKSLVIDNLNGMKLTKDAPEGANYVDGVYFKVGEQFFYIDMNGSSVIKVGDKGYVELEHYRYHALTALFEQYGVSVHSH